MAAPTLGTSVFTPLPNTSPSLTSSSITTTGSGSSFLLVVVRQNAGVVSSVSDSKSNSYTLIDSQVESNDGTNLSVYVCENGTGGSSHTFTCTMASGNVHGVGGIEIVGALSTGIVDTSAKAYDSATPFNCSITTTVVDTLAIALIHTGASSGGAYTANGGFTKFLEDNSTVDQFCAASQTAATAASYDPAWTHSTVGEHALITLAIKPAAGATTTLMGQACL